LHMSTAVREKKEKRDKKQAERRKDKRRGG
jgi:hypothetical protein